MDIEDARAETSGAKSVNGDNDGQENTSANSAINATANPGGNAPMRDTSMSAPAAITDHVCQPQ